MTLLKINNLQSFSDKCASGCTLLAFCLAFITFTSDVLSINNKINLTDDKNIYRTIEITSFKSIQENEYSIDKKEESSILPSNSKDNFAKNKAEKVNFKQSIDKRDNNKNSNYQNNKQKNKTVSNIHNKNKDSDTLSSNTQKESSVNSISKNSQVQELISVVVNRINSIKNYPARARNMNQQGDCLLTVKADNTGHIVFSEIKSKSRFPILNRECSRLAKILEQYDTKILNNEITINIPIRFRLGE